MLMMKNCREPPNQNNSKNCQTNCNPNYKIKNITSSSTITNQPTDRPQKETITNLQTPTHHQTNRNTTKPSSSTTTPTNLHLQTEPQNYCQTNHHRHLRTKL